MSKKIAILTSGGDCAGLNAVIRAVTLRAVNKYKFKVIGIKDGTLGLTSSPLNIVELKPSDFVGNLMRMGGTFLGSNNKAPPLNKKDEIYKIIKSFKKLNIDALIGIGGDGSMKILQNLARKGNINFVGIPKTIDNDVKHNELSIGYDTAVDVATNALDMLQPTAASHRRVMILEVMGRDAGHIALNSGIAGGADVILIPEIPYSLKSIAKHIENIRSTGRNHALIIVAESVRKEDPSLPKVVAAGEDNPLGNRAIYLSMPSYLIHGTNKPYGVGMRVSHGCIRLYPEDIEILYELVNEGTKVNIINQPIKAGWNSNKLYIEVHILPDYVTSSEEKEVIKNTDLYPQAYEIVQKAAGLDITKVDWNKVKKAVNQAKGIPIDITINE